MTEKGSDDAFESGQSQRSSPSPAPSPAPTLEKDPVGHVTTSPSAVELSAPAEVAAQTPTTNGTPLPAIRPKDAPPRSIIGPPIRPRPFARGPLANQLVEVDAVGEDVLRQVEQMDSLINAQASRSSIALMGSPRGPSAGRKSIVGYLEQKALSLLASGVDAEHAVATGVFDPGDQDGVSDNGGSTTTSGKSRKVYPHSDTNQKNRGVGDSHQPASVGTASAENRARRQSSRKSIGSRSSTTKFDAHVIHPSVGSTNAGGRREARAESSRRSSVSASIKEDVSKFKLTVTRMFEKASQITMDEERQARVAELVDSEVMVLNANQLAQIHKRKAHRLTISIHSKFRLWWDFVITVSIAYVIVITPIKVGFDQRSTGMGYASDVVVDLIYLVEMMLNFFTSYEDDATGDEVKELVKIRQNYLKSWFLVDAVSSFPSSLVGTTNGLLTMTKILKVARVAKISDSGLVRIVAGRINRTMNPSLLRMLKLTVIFIISQHLIACTYYYISLHQAIETSWGPSHEIRENDSLAQQYVDAFHFAIMVTTANDVNPTTSTEKLFTSVMLFVGIVINASIIGSAANLLSNLDKEEIARKNQMDSINSYLRFKKVPLKLQNKIRRYYEFALTTRLQDPMLNMFADLPDRLKLLLKLSLHSEFVGKVPLFRALSQEGIMAIIQCLVPVVAMPGEIIIVHGEMATEFYFIRSGQVSLCVPGLVENVPLGNLGEGSFFGEASLLTGEPTTAEVKAERMCELMYLTKDDFEVIIDKFPTFFLAVRRISESRMQTAQNVQKISKMSHRSTHMLKIKQLSLRSVAKAALLKSRIGSGLKSSRKISGMMSGHSGDRSNSFISSAKRIGNRRKSIPSFNENFIEHLSLAQARHLTHLRAMSDMRGVGENAGEDANWD